MTAHASPGFYRTCFLSVVLLVAGLLIYLWGHVQTMGQGQQLARLQDEHRRLVQMQKRLHADIAGLRQSSRIREIAVEKLGMNFPGIPPQNLYLKTTRDVN